MNPQVERLNELLARVQQRRAEPRVLAVEPVVETRSAENAVIDGLVDDAIVVAETPRPAPAPVAVAAEVHELVEVAPKAAPADFDISFDEPSAPGALDELVPASVETVAASMPASAPQGDISIDLAASAALSEPAVVATAEALTAEPASPAAAATPGGPVPVALPTVKVGAKPIVHIAVPLSARAVPSFGDVIGRTLGLRPR